MLSEDGHWRTRSIHAGLEGEHEGEVGKDGEAKAVCDNMIGGGPGGFATTDTHFFPIFVMR